MGHLREKDVLDLQTVQYAILETDGNLSVFPYPKHVPASAMEAGIRVKAQLLPVTIIEDGCLLRQNLEKAGKDERWVQRVLAEKNADIRGTWLLSVDARDTVRWLRKEDAK